MTRQLMEDKHQAGERDLEDKFLTTFVHSHDSPYSSELAVESIGVTQRLTCLTCKENVEITYTGRMGQYRCPHCDSHMFQKRPSPVVRRVQAV